MILENNYYIKKLTVLLSAISLSVFLKHLTDIIGIAILQIIYLLKSTKFFMNIKKLYAFTIIEIYLFCELQNTEHQEFS